MDPAHVEWSRAMFAMLADGGMWGVPQDGLIFQRQGDKLVLTSAIPWEDDMPISEVELREQQREGLNLIRAHFGAAGIDVEGEI